MKELLKNTFMDHDGSLSIPELTATGIALLSIVSEGWDFFYRGHSLDLQAIGIGTGALVLALGTAQRIRDGLWKPGDGK